jgi:hypothetical protein
MEALFNSCVADVNKSCLEARGGRSCAQEHKTPPTRARNLCRCRSRHGDSEVSTVNRNLVARRSTEYKKPRRTDSPMKAVANEVQLCGTSRSKFNLNVQQASSIDQHLLDSPATLQG